MVLVAFASLSIYTLLVDSDWLSADLTSKMNFIPMVCITLAYVGVGSGYSGKGSFNHHLFSNGPVHKLGTHQHIHRPLDPQTPIAPYP